ncbi:MAG: phosphoribosylformylglycinamidine synthase [Dehalococcoidia bacterium]|nr:phosphoribosylformylglycinamidine synthase [Dehalococcoidia bacterium]|tara:strand:- start:31393 stop:31650 length:258 start_codon:yes stop_codon:yes gene_type:complete
MYLAKVRVTLKQMVNDPQGLTVLGALKNLGFQSVEDVRVGKYMEIKIDESSRTAAETQVNEMAEKLLSNPVIEEFTYTLEDMHTR